MTEGQGETPPAILIGRRALEGVSGYRLLDDIQWHEQAKRWFLRCRLTIPEAADALTPAATDWYLVLESRYPTGTVKLFPAKAGGITGTYPHQHYNGPGWEDRPWRTGDICVTTPDTILGRLAAREEPTTSEHRLVWNVERALLWLAAASAGDLPLVGEPFEIPDFPLTSDVDFAFAEDRSTIHLLMDKDVRGGLVDLVHYQQGPRDRLLVRRFRGPDRASLAVVGWGPTVEGKGALHGAVGAWLLLATPPLVGPWQVPITWGELRDALAEQSVSFDDLLLPLLDALRDGRPHLLLVGFPMPETNGGDPIQLHWQALRVPVLAHAGTRPPDGFRSNPVGWRRADRHYALALNAPLQWVHSDNWSEANAHARGRFSASLVGKKVLLIGAGALGSALSEILVRGGLTYLAICDPDDVEHGNLARHVLTMADEGVNKAQALAARLSAITPHLSVRPIAAAFPDLPEADRGVADGCDLIVDCTAEYDTLSAIEDHNWQPHAYAVSIAFGWYVQRAYVVAAPAADFAREAVVGLLEPLVDADFADHPDAGMTREGPGCWHAVFPGRIDDVWLMAAAAAKELDRFVEEKAPGLRGTMIKWTTGDSFEGIARQTLAP